MPSLPWGSCSFSPTPLRSKYTTSLFATTVLLLVLFLVSFPKTTYSYESVSSAQLGISLNRVFEPALDGAQKCLSRGGDEGDGNGSVWDWEEEEEEEDKLECEGSSLGVEQKRDTTIMRGLGNGIPGRYNLQFGDINYWVLEASELFSDNLDARGELRRRHPGGDHDEDEHEHAKRQNEPSVELYITFNTCLQPQPNAALPSAARPKDPPPALQLFVSTTSDNQTPGPETTAQPQTELQVTGGFASLTINATGPIWVGVYAPKADNINLWQEIWNYELALSTTKPYHNWVDGQFVYLVDADNNAALLITGNMSTTSSNEGGVDEDIDGDELLARAPPYTLYAQNTEVISRFSGLERSYCAVTKLAQIRPSSLDTSMTTRGLGNLPKEQFHLKELNHSSTYLAFLARPNVNDSGGIDGTSGTLWRSMDINTKSDGNCQIIYNLPFCSEVAYAVPSNPTLFDMQQLITFYDDNAASWYKNFSYSLQQIPCNTSKASAYSLARNCTDCDNAYKNWLCAVTIPRCMDWTSELPFLANRAWDELFYNGSSASFQTHPHMPPLTAAEVAQHEAEAVNQTGRVSSRNKQIDVVVQPGPYKEVKPCLDLCWTLVQSCPSAFGFACPPPHSYEGGQSYGEREVYDLTCSYLGAVYFFGGASGWSTGWWGGGGKVVWALGVAVWFLLWEGL